MKSKTHYTHGALVWALMHAACGGTNGASPWSAADGGAGASGMSAAGAAPTAPLELSAGAGSGAAGKAGGSAANTGPSGRQAATGGSGAAGARAAGSGGGGMSGALAGAGAGGAGGAGIRPFSSDSPWNSLIGPNPALESDSAARITDLRMSSSFGEHLDVNIARYSIPLFYADASTPKQLVQCDIGGLGFSGGSDGMNRSAMIPWPTGAQPDPESDHHILIVDRSTKTEWGMWNVQQKSGKWTCGLGASMDLTGTGVRPVAHDNPTWYTSHGARACGFPLIAGLIRREEIQAGVIEHALVFAYPHSQAGLYTSPASTAQAKIDAEAIKSRGIPCGGRIQFDPAKDLDALKLSRSGRAIVLALQKYGAFMGDHSGAISLYADGSPDAQTYFKGGVLDMYELRDKIDLKDLRVLKLGTLYDNGNGE
jgi:hypothetical protein